MYVYVPDCVSHFFDSLLLQYLSKCRSKILQTPWVLNATLPNCQRLLKFATSDLTSTKHHRHRSCSWPVVAPSVLLPNPQQGCHLHQSEWQFLSSRQTHHHSSSHYLVEYQELEQACVLQDASKEVLAVPSCLHSGHHWLLEPAEAEAEMPRVAELEEALA